MAGRGIVRGGRSDAVESPREYDESTVADSFPQNPFKPGAGRPPAHMGRRPEVERPLLEVLTGLRTGEADNQLVYLYGPRGNGKTVLLGWLREQANRQGGGAIAFVRLIPEDLESPEQLCRRVVGALRRTPGILDHLSVDLETGIPGLFKVKLGGRDDPILGLSDWLDRDRHPVLFAVDEAHEADPARLGRFLNAVQRAGEHRAVCAVLAGTPGLQDALSAGKASFWTRGRSLAVGLLSESEARAVLARPFIDAGLGVDDDAVAELARAADDYPFFLQLYGAEAWDVVGRSGSRRLLTDHVPDVIRATSAARRQYYAQRYDEFLRVGALPLAKDVASAFQRSAAPMTNAEINRLLARHAGNPAELRSLLNAGGYVWRDDDDRWTPGIPSLMDYVLEETAPGPDRREPAP